MSNVWWLKTPLRSGTFCLVNQHLLVISHGTLLSMLLLQDVKVGKCCFHRSPLMLGTEVDNLQVWLKLLLVKVQVPNFIN